MTPLLILAAINTSALLQSFIILAIACVIFWGIAELLKWWGVTIPRPIVIVLTVLIGVALIIWIARLFGVSV